ncbi:hexokinase-domain-containing protein [Phascolomyces articulosus]|uniref:Phosphotransferase n=1 Tax=Phascolomyces articulosus TaxID=60185 RepID=A0AAD5KA28_9FUNG|nr:hexokinase-domain-containing protein [Phascolomyces articulosus]
MENPADAGLCLTDDQKRKALEELIQDFDLSTENLKNIIKHLLKEMESGLKHDNTNVPMLPSWITRRPTGQEVGEYIGLELSGSSIRIYLVTLHGKGKITTRQQKYPIHEHLKKGSINALIDYLAVSVDSFLSFVGKGDCRHQEPIGLGFVISFPLHQTALNNASVIRWTKDFAVTNADGKNIVDLLQTGLDRRHIPVTVEATCNGAVGCLLAHGYRSLDTLLSCTVSTGTNAAYWEQMANVQKCLDPNKPKPMDSGDDVPEMIINTEWGSFGDENPEYLPRTMYDNRVNRESTNPGVHIFEKMISGLYLGEIARNIMTEFQDRGILFHGNYSPDLNTPNTFEAAYMSAIESDDTPELADTKHIMECILNVPSTTLDDRRVVKQICELVGRRAARLTAAAISAIIQKRDALEGGLTISVEGTIYEHYPNFPNRVNEALRGFYGHSVDRINIGITRDGNGIGGALAAMLAREERQEKAKK